MNVAPDILPLLASFGVGELEANASPVCGLGPDLRISYTNPAWSEFAVANGASPAFLGSFGVGSCLLDVIPAPLDEFFRSGFRRCAKGNVWTHDYECSSADVYRMFRMTSYPLDQGGFVVVHSLRIETGHDRAELPPDGHVNEHGLVVQCSHCRRTRRATQPERWDWVPAYVRCPPAAVSHGLCAPCAGHYYQLGLPD